MNYLDAALARKDSTSLQRSLGRGGIVESSDIWVGPGSHPDTYRLLSLLGAGGEGEVWLAELTLSDSARVRVALKIMPGAKDLAEEEEWVQQGHLLKQLASPGLVHVLDVFVGPAKHREGQRPADEAAHRYVAMKYVEGPTLLEWLDEHRDASVAERLALMRTPAHALDELHRGVVASVPVAHGDIKPSNLVVEAPGRAVLVDLGLTRLPDGPGQVGLSLPFAAPELILGSGAATPQSDRFSFAATLVQVLTDEVPRVGVIGVPDPDAVESQLRECPRLAGRDDLVAAVVGVLRADPAGRPPSISGWLTALGQVLTATSSSVPTSFRPASARVAPVPDAAPEGRPVRRPPSPTRHRLVTGALTVAAALTTVLVILAAVALGRGWSSSGAEAVTLPAAAFGTPSAAAGGPSPAPDRSPGAPAGAVPPGQPVIVTVGPGAGGAGPAGPAGPAAAGSGGGDAAGPPAAGAGAGAAGAGPAGAGAGGVKVAPGSGSGTAGDQAAAVPPGPEPDPVVDEPSVVPLPGPVGSMSLSGEKETTMVVSWAEAPRATGYQLGWTESGTGKVWLGERAEYTLGGSPVTLTNLLPGHTYAVRVTPSNGSGDGPTTTRSGTTAPEPPPPPPPSPVGSMSVSTGSSTTLVLSWSAAPRATGYQLGWTESGTGRVWLSPRTEFGLGDSPVTLINLLPGHTYSVRVTPFNGEGDGPTTTQSGTTSG